jgi:hypothetical protein
MSGLGPNERNLLEALRSTEEPTDDDRRRVRARVLGRVAATAGVTALVAKAAGAAPGAVATGTASTAPPAAAIALGSWKMASAVVVLVGATGGGAWLSTRHAHEPATPIVDVTPGPAKANAAAPPTETKTEEATNPKPRRPAAKVTARRDVTPPKRVSRPSAPGVPEADLEQELSLMERAQQSLTQGDPEGALSSLDQHAAEHPDGLLSIERQGVRAIALCQSGSRDEGQRVARRFLNSSPKSPVAARVRAACFEGAR